MFSFQYTIFQALLQSQKMRAPWGVQLWKNVGDVAWQWGRKNCTGAVEMVILGSGTMKDSVVYQAYSSNKWFRFQGYRKRSYNVGNVQKEITDTYMGPEWFDYGNLSDDAHYAETLERAIEIGEELWRIYPILRCCGSYWPAMASPFPRRWDRTFW